MPLSELSLEAVILAAGLGTRMRSSLPKVLHRLAGRPLIDYALDLAAGAGAKKPIVVLNPHQAEVASHVEGRAEVVYQREQLGTGHAVQQVPPERLTGKRVLLLYGDMPLLTAAAVGAVVEAQAGHDAALATVADPSLGHARVVRGADGSFSRIVEVKDLTDEERAVQDLNVGLYCFDGDALVQALPLLAPDNAAGELYLTDVFGMLGSVEIVELEGSEQALGVNDRVQLAAAEAEVGRQIAARLMLSGVTFIAPETCRVEAGVEIGQDTVIEPFTIVRGRTRIGSGCHIGPHADIADSEIGDGCTIQHSWLRECRVGDGSDCGPFSKLRPGTELSDRVHVGSFAEVVRSKIGSGSAVPHFAYVGDAVVGERVNIAAGTITANYDSEKKNQTVIEDDVFVGVDTMLVAPVKLGRGSRTGAGSVVTKDVPDGATAVGVPARALRKKESE